MPEPPPGQVTRLLDEVAAGSRQASEELLPLLYDALRRLARARMARERGGQTLQPTALVHEAYLRLLGDTQVGWESRGHFFAAAAEAMRRVLIERARRHGRLKRGGDLRRIDLEGVDGVDARSTELLALDLALDRLAERDPEMAQVVKLRYFAGLSVEETAEALGSSPRSVNRQWTAAKAWLQREIDGAGPSGNDPGDDSG